MNNNNITTHSSCFVANDSNGNPTLTKCSEPLGYPTVAAAKEAEIKEIKEKTQFDLETISGLFR
jgi:hypothetical protein